MTICPTFSLEVARECVLALQARQRHMGTSQHAELCKTAIAEIDRLVRQAQQLIAESNGRPHGI